MKGYRFILHEPAYTEFKGAAKRYGTTFSAWIRQAITERIKGTYAPMEGMTTDIEEWGIWTQDRQVHINLSPELHDEMRLVASERGESLSLFVRRAGIMRFYFDRKAKQIMNKAITDLIG